jgi:TrmH family RNA methyltransferase
VRTVIAASSVKSTVEGHVRGLKQVRVVEVEDALFNGIALTESSQGVIALVKPPEWSIEQLFRGRPLVVVLDGVQDPGNAGTIVRSAEAFGATGVIFGKGTVSPFNAKTLRAAAGSLFRIPFVRGLDAVLVRTILEQRRVRPYAADAHNGMSLAEADLAKRAALVVGSEGRGVSDKLRSASTPLRIATAGVESLNAAVAASVILYEASRQRMVPR